MKGIEGSQIYSYLIVHEREVCKVQIMATPPQEITLKASTQYSAYDHAKATSGCIAMATVKAPLYEPQSRSAVDIVAVIDRSGSMAGLKLNLVKKTLLFVIDQLKATDRISLVLYDDCVEVEFPLTLMTKENKEITKAKVEKIRDRSATNLCGGLLKGMEQIIRRKSDEKAKVASVLLFTDGLANRGITGFNEIIRAMKDPIGSLSNPGVLNKNPTRHLQFGLPQRNMMPPPILAPMMQQQAPPPIPMMQQQAPVPVPMMQQQAPPQMMQQQIPPPPQMMQQQAPSPVPMMQQQAPPPPPMMQQQQQLLVEDSPMEPESGIVDFEGTVYTFGFGSDHNGDLLTAISNAANGVYYYIDSTEKIAESFADCLGGLLSVVGQNMTLTIEAQPNCTLGQVHYKNKPDMSADKKRCVVSLGDLQSEEERDIIIPITLEARDAECAAQPLIKVYLSYFNVITALMQTASFDLTVDRKLADGLQPDEAVSVQLQRVSIALALEEARKIAPLDLHRARSTLEQCKASLIQSGVSQHELCKALLTDLSKAVDDLKDQQSYRDRGSHSIASYQQEHISQRANKASPSYVTAAKSAMRSQTLGMKF